MIKVLNASKFMLGDVEVFMSHDEEGNGFGTVTKESFGEGDNFIIIYPFEEHMEYEELEKRCGTKKVH